MDLKKYINSDPIMTIDTACSIIANAYIHQNGIPHTSNITDFINSLTLELEKLIELDKSIWRECRTKSPYDIETGSYIVVEEYCYEDYYCDTHYSVVNIVDLLNSYNSILKEYGIKEIELITNNNHPSCPDIHFATNDIMELSEALSLAVKDLYNRDDKITNDLFDAIFAEFTNRISYKFTKLLPNFKSYLRQLADDKFTTGRLSSITTKKIQAAIELAEWYKDKDSKELSYNDILERLKKSRIYLLKKDRNDVANIFLKTKSE